MLLFYRDAANNELDTLNALSSRVRSFVRGGKRSHATSAVGIRTAESHEPAASPQVDRLSHVIAFAPALSPKTADGLLEDDGEKRWKV
jgi:hypothetical protein